MRCGKFTRIPTLSTTGVRLAHQNRCAGPLQQRSRDRTTKKISLITSCCGNTLSTLNRLNLASDGSARCALIISWCLQVYFTKKGSTTLKIGLWHVAIQVGQPGPPVDRTGCAILKYSGTDEDGFAVRGVSWVVGAQPNDDFPSVIGELELKMYQLDERPRGSPPGPLVILRPLICRAADLAGKHEDMPTWHRKHRSCDCS